MRLFNSQFYSYHNIHHHLDILQILHSHHQSFLDRFLFRFHLPIFHQHKLHQLRLRFYQRFCQKFRLRALNRMRVLNRMRALNMMNLENMKIRLGFRLVDVLLDWKTFTDQIAIIKIGGKVGDELKEIGRPLDGPPLQPDRKMIVYLPENWICFIFLFWNTFW